VVEIEDAKQAIEQRKAEAAIVVSPQAVTVAALPAALSALEAAGERARGEKPSTPPTGTKPVDRLEDIFEMVAPVIEGSDEMIKAQKEAEEYA
jgi:hypothetical protein